MERLKLKRLLRNIPVQAIKGSKEVEITGLTANSKTVAPGNLFIAKKGFNHDGARFIPDAIANGAVAILTDLYDPFFPQVTQIIHSDVSSIEALIAKEYYGHPSDHLFLIGITGTNGKTTTSYLIRHLFNQLEEECGLIGTIEWIVGQHVFPSSQTTPDVLTNYKLFHEMVLSGSKSCVMEVSSHALDQGRVGAIAFDTAVFTNLTQDHLDYHGTMEAYAQAKAKLFSGLLSTAVVNADVPEHLAMIAQCPAKILRYGIDHHYELFATEVSLSSQGTRFVVNAEGKSIPFHSSLIGRYNIYNVLAAIGVGLSRGFALEKILGALKSFRSVPGRLEAIVNAKGLNLFVDYAHTDDALFNVLKTVNEFKKGRLITVFGCGGNRDVTKRPKMGAVAEALSDLVIITSDNPRQEDPTEIIRQILSGLKDPAKAQVIVDREEAIQRAVKIAHSDDIVLIAGKGHENYQVFSDQTIQFDDRIAARQACLDSNLSSL